MEYPARFTPAEEGGYVVTFRDVPEAITQGDTLEEAMLMASDALVSALECYTETGRQLPIASAKEQGELLVSAVSATE